ncbi:5'-3' exonuclease H3TH domain-containing protein [Patulibacter brassicae]|uniref:5'-3' exonuclease n=1 Tax=Patulibacter brassicae TaxID=1705717 RepID=A0ABU4VL88_9ACTN|nr:5'-3' exonuclease H3TH domain-containing protein [Patulibacter brassicae]MDX8151696.1 5'-3' exonuclease H3TH domain-containing protein [Patulibacter brassicae]
MPGPLLLLDVPWLLYRAHFALPSSIAGADGEPIGALLGTVRTILLEVQELDPVAVVCATGAEEAVHRTALLPAYHAHREPMPDALRRRWEQAPDLLRAFGWSVRDGGDLEADDVMATLARRHVEEDPDATAAIATADRDLLACVGERVVARRPPAKGQGPGFVTVDVDGVRELLGVEPGQVTDLIALRGDPSDGIPGAPGIGAKTAARLLAAHGDLEGVLRAAGAPGPDGEPGGAPVHGDGLTPRLAAVLREHAAEVRRDREVARLVEADVEPVAPGTTDREGGAAAAEALGMTRLAAELRGEG